MELDGHAYSSSLPLHVGDYIILRLSKPEEGFLASEGLLDDECFVTTTTDNFDNCIWEIHVQNQYSASREYKEALAQSLITNDAKDALAKFGKGPVRKQITKDHLSQLHRASLNEQRLNDKLMSIKLGKPIMFGDPIQLRHVKSKKFLTISSHILAREERENMRINVDSDGDSLSCLGFMPRYRYDREGQVLTNNAEVMVRVHERPGEYLHAAKAHENSMLQKNEVNCSLETSFWTLHLYQRVTDVKPNSIMAGQLVTLQDPDSLSCVTLDQQIPGVTQRANVVMSPQFQIRDLNSDSIVGTNLLWLIEKSSITNGGSIGMNSEAVTLRDLNTGLFMKVEETSIVAVVQREHASLFEFHNSQNSNHFSSSILESESAVHLSCNEFWFGNLVKGENSRIGSACCGVIDKSVAVSLSVSAGLFHKIGANLHVAVQATMILRRLIQTTDKYEKGNTSIRELSNVVKVSTGVLENLCTFLALAYDSGKDDGSGLGGVNNKDIIQSRQNMAREQGLVDAVLDLLVLTGTNIYDKIREPIIKRDSNVRASIRKTRRNSIGTGSSNSQNDSNDNDNVPFIPKRRGSVDKNNPPHRSSGIMSMVRSNGTNIYTGPSQNNKLLAIGEENPDTKPKAAVGRLNRSANISEIGNARKAGLKVPSMEENSDSDDDEDEDEDEMQQSSETQLTVSQLLAQKCLKVLLCLIVDNFTNQIYVADRFPVLLGEVRDHRLAVLCVEEMLKENLTILQTKVRKREIDIFVGLLAHSEMSVTFLRLLQSTCSCPMGVDATQRMVTNALFGPPVEKQLDDIEDPAPSLGLTTKSRSFVNEVDAADQKLMMKITADFLKTHHVEWGDFSLYCSSNQLQHVLGYSELSEGLPEIWLSWMMQGKNGDFGMTQLFGYKDKVPLAVVCGSMRKTIAKTKGSAFESISAKAFRRKATIYKKKGHAVKHNHNHTIMNIANFKSQVAEYFKTQLYLVADLSLDRNYVAIGVLEKLYSFDLLLAMFKSDLVPSTYKAPVCRVIRTLYVDREPQVASMFPRYIRTSVSLGAEAENSNGFQEAEPDKVKFALIQKILSDYINHQLNLAYCDDLSAESLELLQALVNFGFYDSVPQIFDVLKPLLQVLINHQTSPVEEDLKSDSSENADKKKLSILQRAKSILTNTFSNAASKYKQITPSDYSGKSGDTIEGEEEEVKPSVDWRKKSLETIDSVSWMVAVFVVVILSVLMMLISIFSDLDLSQFYVATTIFFGVELLLRFLVYGYSGKGLPKFMYDPFNWLDFALVLLDIIMLALNADGSQASAGRATRSLRIIRIIRVARLVRAARLIKKMADASTKQNVYEVPERFKQVKKYEAKTIVSIIKVMLMFYDRIQDKTMDLAIKAFSIWCKELKNNQKCNAVEIYHHMLASEERISAELSSKFDNVILDVMMYSDSDITQEALNLMMVHKSQKDLFFQVFEKIQIIYSPRIENICKNLTEMLRELKRLAEMFEIWSELASDDDLKSANRVMEILNNIWSYIAKRNEDRSLGIRSLILVDEEVQNLLRNLDAMNSFMALQESLYDGGREELKPPIVKILKTCNDLICLFVKTSEANQVVAFKHLPWFVDRVDDGINSMKVARFIVEGNKALIKQCSRRYLSDFAHKIVSKGKKPEYLDLFVGMTELSEVMGSHVLVVETEISTYLTAREWKKHILLWCAPPDSDEYVERRKVMEQYLQPNAPPCTEEDLCPELQYHIRVLILLANCNLGPKLHAIYPVGDILAAILDHSTIFPVKRALGNLMIEVLKSSSDRVEKLESFWQLLDQIALGFETLPSDIVQLSRSPILRIQRGEWVEICAGIIISFFQYFDLLGFNETRADKTGRGIGDAKAIIDRLHTAVRTLIESHAGKLGSAITEELMYASSILNHHLDPENLEVEGTAADLNETKLKLARMQHQRTSVVFADVQQIFLRKQFKHFLRQIRDASLGSRNDVVDFFKSIPWTDETVQSDVRFEPLLKKLTSHFRSLIKRTPLSRSIHESAVDTCKWLLKALRHLFEDALGVSCDHFYDIDVTLVQNSPRLMKLRQVYNDNGVTYLCLDLIAVGMDHGIYIEAMRMLIALMLKSGGCLDIQKSINLYLFETDSILFFELIKDMVESLKSWSGKENEINSQQVVGNNMQGAASSIPEDIIVLNLLQVFCDGAYMNNRDQIRDQVGNSKIVNILESLASYVGILSRSENLSNTYIAIILLKTILRLVQGPCKKNQEQFVLHTELLISLNRMIRSARPALRSISPVWSDYLEDLKEGIVDVLRGVIEGQAKTSLVFDRVATTIDFSVLQVLVFPVDEVDDVIVLDQIMGANKLTKAQAKYLVLTETMNKTVDSLQMQTKSDHLIKSISSVEVQWNNQVQIVYFPVPDFVLDLSIEARNKAIEASQENPSREVKLVEFVKQCKILYRQSLHQQFLKKYGLADLWTVKYYLTRFMFINALVMNALILAFYGTQSHGEESYGGTSHHRMLAGAAAPTSYTETKDHLYIEPDVKLAINILNIVQFVCAIVTVAIFALVQVPVTFSAELEKYGQLVPAIFWTMLDPLPIWYFTYGVFAFLGLEVHPFFLSALLLDWVVLDPTTQDLLLAVQYPARQLVATLVIILICQNIFAGIMFVMYRHDVITVPVKDMWDALKLCISYGFRGEYGIDHEMEPTLGIRMLLDVAFYFIILSILRHIFFAIIVDTFGKLRELKFERESEAKNTCFICGIERHDFDRIVSANAGNGFAHHKSFAHNPLNYLSFIMSVWNQSQSEDSSLEIYVRGCLENGDLAWFPTGVLQEAQLIEVEAHAEHESEHDKGHKSHHEEKKGHGGGHGHGHGHGGGHGHGHGHGHGKSGHQSHQKHVAERSHTDDAYQSEMIEKMNTMQKQLLKLSKSFGTTHASMSNPVEFGSPKIEYNRSPLKQSVGDLPDLHIAEDPVITTVSQTNTSTRRSSGMYDVNESIDRMNTTIERVMDRIDTMEKRLSKSHKYLRHRIRAQGDAVKSSQVASKTPTATILSRLQQVKKSVAENTGLTGPPVPSTPSPPFSDGSNDRRQQEELIKMTTPPKQTNNANYDSEPADKSNYESDSESSGSLCTAPSDSENAAVRKARPQSAKSPARATNRGSILLARPQSAQPPSVSRSPVHLSGPPQNLIPKGWN